MNELPSVPVEEEKVNLGELVLCNKSSLEKAFMNGSLKPVLEKIREVSTNFVADASTEKGRAEIKSMARKVASSKTYLDALGKSITEDWRAKTKIINGERTSLVEYLDNLKEEIRKPVTDFENIEKDRIQKIQDKIEGIERSVSIQVSNSKEAHDLISSLENIIIDESFQEFESKARHVRDNALAMLKPAYQGYLAMEESARKEAEAKKEAVKKAIEEQARKEQEEKMRFENEKRERERLAQERKKKEEQEKREQDIEHRNKIKAAAAAVISKELLVSKEYAMQVLNLIEVGRVPNVSIKF